jgi:hypothetical protein
MTISPLDNASFSSPNAGFDTALGSQNMFAAAGKVPLLLNHASTSTAARAAAPAQPESSSYAYQPAFLKVQQDGANFGGNETDFVYKPFALKLQGDNDRPAINPQVNPSFTGLMSSPKKD